MPFLVLFLFFFAVIGPVPALASDAGFLAPKTGQFTLLKGKVIDEICAEVLQPPSKKRSGIEIPRAEATNLAFVFTGAQGKLVTPTARRFETYVRALGKIGTDIRKLIGKTVVEVECDFNVSVDRMSGMGIHALGTSLLLHPRFGSHDETYNQRTVIDLAKKAGLDLSRRRGDFPTNLSFEDFSVDHVLVMETLNFLNPLSFQQAVWEVVRILKFGGTADFFVSLDSSAREDRQMVFLKRILDANEIKYDVFPEFPNALRIRKNWAFTPRFKPIE